MGQPMNSTTNPNSQSHLPNQSNEAPPAPPIITGVAPVPRPHTPLSDGTARTHNIDRSVACQNQGYGTGANNDQLLTSIVGGYTYTFVRTVVMFKVLTKLMER